MPRNFLRRYLPKRRTMLSDGRFKMLGDILHSPDLWHLNRHSFAGGIAAGMFIAFVPVPGQMLLAALAALALRVNLPIAVATVWVSNPITIPPLGYLCYKIGTLVLGTPEKAVSFEWSLDWISGQFLHIWEPLLLGSFIMACASSVLGYFLAHGIWRGMVLISWNARLRRNKRKLILHKTGKRQATRKED